MARLIVYYAHPGHKHSHVNKHMARAARDAGTGTALDVHQAELGVDSTRVAVQRALLSLALIEAETLMVRGETYAAKAPEGGKS